MIAASIVQQHNREREETPLTIDHAQSATIDMTEALAAEVQRRSPRDAAQLLGFSPAAMVVAVLQSLNPAVAQDILDEFPAERRGALLAAASPQQRAQWLRNDRYPEDTIGRLMEPPTAVFRGTQTIAQTIETVRELSRTTIVTYVFIVDGVGHLIGVVTMRDLLLSDREQKLEQVMLRDPFSLTPETEL